MKNIQNVKFQLLLLFAIMFLGIQLTFSQSTEVRVGAKDGWVNTGIHVHSGTEIGFNYVSGSWTCDVNNHRSVDAEGHTNEAQSGLAQFSAYKTTQKAPFGCMLAALENGGKITIMYIIGNSHSVNFNQSGTVYLKINDEGLGDNSGSITMKVWKKGSMAQMPQPAKVEPIKTPKIIRRLDPTNPKNWSFDW